MQHLTWEALKQQYPDDRYIFLLPQVDMHVQHSIPLWRLDVAIVEIDPKDDSLVYPVEGTKDNPKKLALQKPALDRLLAAANGISRAHVVYEIPGQLVRYEGVAAMKGPDGSIRPVSRTRDWIAEVEREVVEAAVNKWYAANEQYADRRWWHKLSDEQKDAERDAKLADLWRRERQFGPPKAESKAIARAIRALLGIRSGYSPEELLAKRFAVPRWVFEPPADNPEILKMLVANALQGQAALYGATTQPAALLSRPAPEPLQLTGGDAQAEFGDGGDVAAARDSGFSPPPDETQDHLQMTGDQDPAEFLRLKVAGATCSKHLQNIVGKYRESAEAQGLGDLFQMVVNQRLAELGGHAPDPGPAPRTNDPEQMRQREIAGLAQEVEREIGARRIGAGQRENLTAQLAKFRASGSLDGLRDMLLWLEQQPQEVQR